MNLSLQKAGLPKGREEKYMICGKLIDTEFPCFFFNYNLDFSNQLPTQSAVAKLTASAKLRPWLNPA